MASEQYRLPANLVDLTRDACWKAFWYKRSLKLFLRQHGIKAGYLQQLDSETKIDFLSNLFYKLADKPMRATHDSILSMARSLSNMTSFPDFVNLPDGKQSIAEAQIAINALNKEYHAYYEQIKSDEEQIKAEKERSEQIQRRIREEANAIAAAESKFAYLISEIKEIVQHIGEQEYGYKFEQWLYKLAKFSDLQSRPSYRGADGHQIDGSINIDGTTLLVEAKLTSSQTQRDQIVLFIDKINHRAENTRGLFVSISGFSESALKDASCDHTPLILMDYSHIFNLLVTRRFTFPELLRRMLSNAAETGSSYLDVCKC